MITMMKQHRWNSGLNISSILGCFTNVGLSEYKQNYFDDARKERKERLRY